MNLPKVFPTTTDGTNVKSRQFRIKQNRSYTNINFQGELTDENIPKYFLRI